MSIELVTGHAGSNHISSDDVARINWARWGVEPHWVGKRPSVQMTNSNTLTIGEGIFFAQGRYFIFNSPENVTINSGAQGQKRQDAVYLRYQKNSYGVETCSIVVLQGDTSSGTWKLSPYTDQTHNALNGDTIVDHFLATVVIDGINAKLDWVQSANNDSISTTLGVQISKTPIDTQWWWISYWATNGVATVSINSKGNGHTTGTWDDTLINPNNLLPKSIRPPHDLWFPVIVDNKSWYGETGMRINMAGEIYINNRGGDHKYLQPLHATGTWAVAR